MEPNWLFCLHHHKSEELCLQAVETESLLKPILSAEEVPGIMIQCSYINLSSLMSTMRVFMHFKLLLLWFNRSLSSSLSLHTVCVHGTYKKNLESILDSGLKRMKRLHVHFSCGLPTDGEVISGKLRKIYLLYFPWNFFPINHDVALLDN